MNYEHERHTPDKRGKEQKKSQRASRSDSETTPPLIHEKNIPTKSITRISGELERKHPEIEPLHPTPITQAAQERLLSWGISEEQIEALQLLTSSFRYDLCKEKAERLAQEKGYVGETPDGGKEVIIPNYYNKSDRFDGQCGDIAVQLSTLMISSGFLEEVNRNRNEELTIRTMKGLSRTHFNEENQKHIWIQLGPKSARAEDTVLIDGSFQEISAPEESGYRSKQENIPMRDFGSDSLVLKVGSYNYDEQTHQLVWENKPCETLGLSQDREVVFSIGFATRTSTPENTILPVVRITSAEHKGDSILCFIDNKGTMITTKKIPETYDDEVRTILCNLVKIPLIEDNNKAFLTKNSHILPPDYRLN